MKKSEARFEKQLLLQAIYQELKDEPYAKASCHNEDYIEGFEDGVSECMDIIKYHIALLKIKTDE